MRLRVIDARPEPPARGSTVLSALERPFLALERAVDRALPDRLNPFAQTGAVANVLFLIAVVSGIVLLFWYVPSVNQAWSSLEDVREQWWGGQLVRSIHRYSSDACMLFVVLHSLRYTFARRFGGPRWLAWVTGLAAVGLLWVVGWLGYWLVWDERAQQVALGTTNMLDVLPLFAEPIGRSFLVNETVNSLLFFVVFFAHMLIPLLGGVFLWLHITRLSRPRFLTSLPLAGWVMGATVVVSLVWPATSAGRAEMLVEPQGFSMDWWYLFPLTMTDRLEGGMLWAVTLGAGVLVFSVPWWAARGKAKVAEIHLASCNACERCVADCPYGALTMVPRTDGRGFLSQAQIDPDKCVGCGICAGACDSGAIGLPQLSVVQVRKNMDAWLAKASKQGGSKHVAFVCATSAGSDLKIDPATGACADLPGYLVWAVPCMGWVHALTIERAFRHGAEGVLLVACGPSSCDFREGALFTELRIAAEREPKLRTEKVAVDRVRVLRLARGDRAAMKREAEAFRSGTPQSSGTAAPKERSRAAMIAAAAVLVVALGAATVVASDAPYGGSGITQPELIVSFAHPGKTGEQCRDLTEEEKAQRPIHMRQDRVCERGRSPVRLRVAIDGRVLHEQAHEPGGLFGDESSVAIVRLPIDPGDHRVELAVGESRDPSEWTYTATESLTIPDRAVRKVILFDRSAGFRVF